MISSIYGSHLLDPKGPSAARAVEHIALGMSVDSGFPAGWDCRSLNVLTGCRYGTVSLLSKERWKIHLNREGCVGYGTYGLQYHTPYVRDGDGIRRLRRVLPHSLSVSWLNKFIRSCKKGVNGGGRAGEKNEDGIPAATTTNKIISQVDLLTLWYYWYFSVLKYLLE